MKKKCDILTVMELLENNKKLQDDLCKIPLVYGLGIGGGLSYRGHTSHDVDLIPLLKKGFLKKSKAQQRDILYKIAAVTPNKICDLPVDKGFFEVVTEYGTLEKYGSFDGENIELVEWACDVMDCDPGEREEQEYVEPIEIIKCKKRRR